MTANGHVVSFKGDQSVLDKWLWLYNCIKYTENH